ncbi:MAG: site-2 protease family protein, partial [Planctomycetota bacterium]
VNGQPVTQYWQVLDSMRRTNGAEPTFTFVGKDGEEAAVQIRPHTGLMAPPSSDPNAEYNLLGLTLLTQVNDVIPGSPAAEVLQSQDVVLAIGEAHYPSIGQLIDVVENSGSQALEVTVLRDGDPTTVTVTPRRGKIGAHLGYAYNTNYIRHVVDGSAFATLNLVDGTRITAVNGRPVESIADIRTAIQDAGDGAIEITSLPPLPDATPESASATLTAAQGKALADLGWYEPFPFEMLRVMQKADSATAAVAIGIEKTHLYMLQTYITLARLLDGGVKVKHMRGPVGIAHEGTRIAEQGFTYLIFFLGLISVNLAVINFLPLPIVDGGQFLLLCWEKVRGKPVPANVQSAIMVVGLAFLGTLFLYITYNDIWRLITG